MNLSKENKEPVSNRETAWIKAHRAGLGSGQDRWDCDLLSDWVCNGISALGTASQEFDGIRRKYSGCTGGRNKHGAKDED